MNSFLARRALAALALLLSASLAEARQCWMTKVTADDGFVEDQFGASSALVGDTLFVGAPFGNTNGAGFPGRNAGSVYVLRRDGLNWFLQQKLVPPDSRSGQAFGLQLASDGQTLVVLAARYFGDDADDPGTLYIYRHGAAGWELAQEIDANGPRLEPSFIRVSLAVAGDWIFVGGHDRVSGVVQLIQRGPAGWERAGKLAPADAPAKLFGNTLVAEGDTLAVSAVHDEHDGPESGSTYVFERNGDVWSQTAKLRPHDPAPGKLFGLAALAGDTIAIAAPRDDTVALESGAVYVFERQGGVWTESAKLAPSELVAKEGLWRVALDGARLVAISRDRGYLFERVGGAWQQRPPFELRGPIGDVGLAGDVLTIADPFDDQRALHAGAVNVYSLGGAPCGSLSMPRVVSWGKQRLEIDRGPAHAGHFYWLGGSMSGTLRGVGYLGSRIPLNMDAYFRALVRNPNQGLFTNNFGVLDANGRASMVLKVPLALYASYAGMAVDHAFVEYDAHDFEYISNAVTMRFEPRH